MHKLMAMSLLYDIPDAVGKVFCALSIQITAATL